jgi:cyclomaltodextrinase
LLGKEILQVSLGKNPRKEIVARSHYSEHKPISVSTFTKRARKALERYQPEICEAQLNLFTSHDTPRLASIFDDDEAGIRLALSLLFAFPGAPCLYYGDEIAMAGAHDPDCRRAFPANLNNHLSTHPLAQRIFSHVKEIAAARSEYESLRRGSTSFLSNKNLIAFIREFHGASPVLVLGNPSFREVCTEIPTPFPKQAKKEFKVLFGEGHIKKINQKLQATLPPRSVVFVVPE